MPLHFRCWAVHLTYLRIKMYIECQRIHPNNDPLILRTWHRWCIKGYYVYTAMNKDVSVAEPFLVLIPEKHKALTLSKEDYGHLYSKFEIKSMTEIQNKEEELKLTTMFLTIFKESLGEYSQK